jgi:hypothetical protein
MRNSIKEVELVTYSPMASYNASNSSIVRFYSAPDQSQRNGSEVPCGRSSPGA